MKTKIIIYVLVICVVCLGILAYTQSLLIGPEIVILDYPHIDENMLEHTYEVDPDTLEEEDKRVPIAKVNWTEPVQIASLPLFKRVVEGRSYGNTIENTEFYLIGGVTEGIHQGKDVLMVRREYSYPGDEGLDYILATKNASGSYTKFELLVYTDSYWNEEIDYDISKVSPLIAKFAELVMPETIKINDITFSYITTAGIWVDNPLVRVVGTTRDVGDVYLAFDGTSAPNNNNGTGGFYVRTKDSRVALYKPDYLNKVAGELIAGEKYRYVDLGGCGSSNITSVVTLPISEFEIIGKAVYDNQPIYELKDKNNKIYKDLYAMAYFDGEYNMENNISFEEFIKRQPVIF
jgi:hypothetical protein